MPQQNLDEINKALQEAQSGYDASMGDYKKRLLASGVIRDVLQKMASEADPSVKQVRTARNAAQEKLGTVFANSMDELQGVTDPAPPQHPIEH